MSSYINYAQLVDSSIIGVRKRRRGSQTKYYRHPLVRNDWWTADHFRGAQGYYFAQGSYKGSPRLYNLVSHPWWSKNVKRPLKLAGDGRFTDSSFTVYFDNENWNLANRHKRKVLTDYLAKPSTAVISGDPNFYQYLAGNLGESAYYKSYYTKRWGRQANFKPLIKLDTEYTDHLTLYRYPSRSKSAFKKSNYNLAVNSYYNFYLETSPPYEDVTRQAGEGVELLIPNLYMLESDIQNTGSVNYTRQLTLDNASNFYDGPELDVWFLQQNQVSPEGNKMYYQQFAEALDDLNTSAETPAIKNRFEEEFKNVVVLYPDLGMLKKYNIRDDRGTPNDSTDDIKSTAFYPFYNEVIIGFDREDLLGVGAKTAERSFFTSLFASKLDADHVRSFIVLLQLYIIENMRQGNVQPSDYEAYETYTVNAKGRSKRRIFSLNNRSETVCDLDSFILALKNDELDYLLEVYNDSREEMADGANYTILREWENQELFKLNIEDALKVVNSREFEDELEERRRSLKEVFSNQECPSETIMYLIEKRRNPPGPGNRGPVIQTIMLSKDVVFSDELKYVDTQIRYGVRYSYIIKQVRMIFGNSYSYDGVSFDFGEMKAGQGRALGNALGFYNPPGEEGLTVNGRDPDLEYTYLAADEVQEPGASQMGHFVFRLPPDVSNNLVAENVVPATPAGAKRSPLGRYYAAVQKGSADLSGLVVELHAGFGVEGAQDGGMTAFNLVVPEEVLASTDVELAPSYADDLSETADPVVTYKEAIDILTDSSGGSQAELNSSVSEINTFFAGLIEDGSRAKVNAFLAKLRVVRDSFIGTTSSQASLGVNDPRSAAARQIYDSVDARVRDLLASSVSSIVEAENEAPANKLLEEVLGTPEANYPHNTGRSFSGGKGSAAFNLRFGKD